MDTTKFRNIERLAIKAAVQDKTVEEAAEIVQAEGGHVYPISIDAEPIPLPANCDMNRLKVKVRNGRVFHSAWG